MHFLSRKKDPHRLLRGAAMDSKHKQQQQQQPQPQPQPKSGPRLERRNAVKNVDYELLAGVSWSSSFSTSEESGLLTTRSLDFPSSSFSSQTSFRIGGSIEGEVDILYRTLGLSGPEDFAVPIAAWEARKVQSASDILPSSKLLQSDVPTAKDSDFVYENPPTEPDSVPPEPSTLAAEEDTRLHVPREEDLPLVDTSEVELLAAGAKYVRDPGPSPRSGRGDGGIRGNRPPILAPPLPIAVPLSPPLRSTSETVPLVLKPPPIMHLPAIDGTSSSWDIVKGFAPGDEETGLSMGGREKVDFEDDDDDEVLAREAAEDDSRGIRLGETSEGFTGTSSYSTMNDDDTSSTTTETMFIISPNGKFKTQIKSWMKGVRLGSGSYGTVYEGISDEGVFFAVKEVSLIDQGINAKQCIIQLEQEIALLSQFEHENIVHYFGTDKEDSKLFIFLELVTQGSLASLYQKYHLRDTQVSAYTRQILNGLNYLHERKVVHRDIKCANILVHANGSVKLADFGLAKQISDLNLLRSCKGSAYWMAPEVVQSNRTYGPSADIWSLGCTVLEMLTRQIPYPNLEWTQALFKIGKGEAPPIPSHLSRDARDFIRQCVKVNPDDRPTALQLLDHPFVKRSLRASLGSNSSSPSVDRWS